jgi:hypothetical protein
VLKIIIADVCTLALASGLTSGRSGTLPLSDKPTAVLNEASRKWAQTGVRCVSLNNSRTLIGGRRVVGCVVDAPLVRARSDGRRHRAHQCLNRPPPSLTAPDPFIQKHGQRVVWPADGLSETVSGLQGNQAVCWLLCLRKANTSRHWPSRDTALLMFKDPKLTGAALLEVWGGCSWAVTAVLRRLSLPTNAILSAAALLVDLQRL